MRIFVAGKLVQRSFEVEDQKRQTVEIHVTHVGPDLRFQSARVGPAAATSVEEVQSS
jgi:single-stranded DNA-binding protein